jgi:hypothetical protein
MKYQTRYFLPCLMMVMLHFNSLIAQISLNGFLNIPFGTKMEIAKKLLLQKPGVKFVRQGGHNILYFTGLSMGAYKADTCVLRESTSKGRFESSNLIFYSKTELLDEIYELLCSTYGNPTKTSSEENDVIYQWEFPVKGSKYKNSISLHSVLPENYFMLSYSGIGMLSPGWL